MLPTNSHTVSLSTNKILSDVDNATRIAGAVDMQVEGDAWRFLSIRSTLISRGPAPMSMHQETSCSQIVMLSKCDSTAHVVACNCSFRFLQVTSSPSHASCCTRDLRCFECSAHALRTACNSFEIQSRRGAKSHPPIPSHSTTCRWHCKSDTIQHVDAA